MARAGAYLYGAGGVLVAASLILRVPGRQPAALGGVAVSAVLVAAVLWRWGHRLPPEVYPVLTAMGTLLISVAVRFGGEGAQAYSFIYVWAALYAFYFYEVGQAFLQVGLIALATALVGDFGRTLGVELLLLVGTVIVVGRWTQRSIRRVQSLARTDPLTGVPNRRAWDEEVHRGISRRRRDGEPLCVAMLDLDHFKIFNDEQGHQAGDRILQQVVSSWLSVLRAGDVLARYGGEEFTILLNGCRLDTAHGIVERLRELVPRGLTCSAGLAEWDGIESHVAMMERCDAALYEAKSRGRNRMVVAPSPADADGNGILAQAARWADTVLRVLASRDVDVVFQPVVRLGDRAITGFEALSRPAGWNGGSVEGLFAAAQRMGLVRELDHLCRRTVVGVASGLSPGLPVFINVSVAGLLDPLHDVDQLLLLLKWAGRRPDDVVLEVSERESVTNIGRLVQVLAAHREHGIRFALDDVGEGRSTFETLAAARPEFIKIATSFTQRVDQIGPRATILAALAFARASGAEVIAEGIEDQRVLDMLVELGVEYGQGYHLGRPAALTSIELVEAH
ncbi:MAG TPA: bifunctional diguanylate cyclase/phosphodiesterase [Candidatus Angelobacter sp.]|jgi:diguanylate cyclase (GGDEF)-like protein|nr:bifunctional diguanylate cyclase/phosphodiesterase [Candidatus Angelobacter sp.]